MSRVLRLFGVRRRGEMPQEFFADQGVARKRRDVLGSEFHVCSGPDHKRYQHLLEEIERERKEDE